MGTYDIAVIPGDGIGPAVTDAALDVLNATAGKYGFELNQTEYDWSTERYLETGSMMPNDGLDQIESADSIFLGAVGHPDVPDADSNTGRRHRLLTFSTGDTSHHVCGLAHQGLYNCGQQPTGW